MDELNFFMRDRNFSEPHRKRLREFFRQTQDMSRQASCNDARYLPTYLLGTALYFSAPSLRCAPRLARHEASPTPPPPGQTTS